MMGVQVSPIALIDYMFTIWIWLELDDIFMEIVIKYLEKNIEDFDTSPFKAQHLERIQEYRSFSFYWKKLFFEFLVYFFIY